MAGVNVSWSCSTSSTVNENSFLQLLRLFGRWGVGDQGGVEPDWFLSEESSHQPHETLGTTTGTKISRGVTHWSPIGLYFLIGESVPLRPLRSEGLVWTGVKTGETRPGLGPPTNTYSLLFDTVPNLKSDSSHLSVYQLHSWQLDTETCVGRPGPAHPT